MSDDRIAGTAPNVAGQEEEGIWRVTGDSQTRVSGITDRATGPTQDLYWQAADAARDTAVSFDKWLRTTVETQPYTSALVAVGIGWLLGRLHRPL